MVSARRVLFAPWFLGAGHTGRCTMAAKILRDAGYECMFLVDPTDGLVRLEGFAVVEVQQTSRPRVTMPEHGYIAILGMDNAYAAAGYYHPARIGRQLDADIRAIRDVGPALIVTDMHPTAAIGARICGIPALSLVDADFLRTGNNSWMYWVPEDAHLTPFPSSLHAFNRVLDERGLPAVADVSELLRTERVLVASIPEIEPVCLSPDSTVEYIGPLLWDPAGHKEPDVLEGFGANGAPNVYITLGSGELAAGEVARAAAVVAAERHWNIFLATGYRGDTGASTMTPWMRVHTFGGIHAAIAWADAVICHGGHATIHAVLMGGKPLVVAPTMSEMEGNGRTMVERTGTGFLLWRTEWDDEHRRLRVVQRYSDESDAVSLTGAKIVRAVNELLNDVRYRQNAAPLADAIRTRAATTAETIMACARALTE
jgi:hypothetical protein